MRTPIGIVGFRGYSGAELITILERHPHAEPVLLEHRESDDKPRPLGHPSPRRVALTPEAVRAEGLAAVFLATTIVLLVQGALTPRAPPLSLENAPVECGDVTPEQLAKFDG